MKTFKSIIPIAFTNVIVIIFLIFMSVKSQIVAETPVSVDTKSEQEKKKDKIDLAESWNQKGEEYFKEKDYTKAGECLYKAIELNPSEAKYIINFARVYMSTEKFAVAEKWLKEAIKRFNSKEEQKKLHIEMADVYYYGAKNFEKKKDHANAIKYYEAAYTIVKFYYPKKVPIVLENIGNLYRNLGQNQKALSYFGKALPISQALGDRHGEGIILHRIGKVYSSLGQNQKALEYYEKALPIMQEVKDRDKEAKTLNGLGLVCSALGQRKKALLYFEEALSIRKESGDRAKIGTMLNSIGLLYSEIGQYQKAVEYLEKSLSLKREIGDRSGKSAVLNNLGKVYHHLSRYQEALEYYGEALQIARSLSDRKGEATALDNIGAVYLQLSQKQKAKEYFETALNIRKKIKDRSGEAFTLQKIGALYFDCGERHKALEYYKKTLPISQEVGEKSLEAATLNNIGVVYADLGKKKKALKYHLRVLEIQKKIGDRFSEVVTMENIGSSYSALGKNQKAQKHYEEALQIAFSIGDLNMNAVILKEFVKFWEKMGQSRFAVFMGKLSVNTFQKMRMNVSSLNLDIQKNYFENKKYVYRKLTDILIEVGRLAEAQQVLDILKEEELYDFTSSNRSAPVEPSTTLDFTEPERQWFERYNKVMEKLAAVKNEHHLLEFKIDRNVDEEKRFQELESQMKEEMKEYKGFMLQIRKIFNEREKDIKKGRIAPSILPIKAAELRETLRYLDETDCGRHAVIQYLAFKDRISVILTVPFKQVVKQFKIDEEELNRMLMTYRYFMMKPGRGAIPIDRGKEVENKRYKKMKGYENRFYKMIFTEIDEELKEYGITNLVVSLDGVLRYLPLGILWDGKHYLLQRYRIAIITPSSLKNIKEEPVRRKKILGLGVGQGGEGFAPLPNVGSEIRAIVEDEEKGYSGVIKGKAFIDNDFTKDTMVTQLNSDGYSLVHIASHFKFSPGDETRNKLLLGDGSTLKLSEIRRMGKLFKNVDLLVLSACQTGVGGNGEEIEGFGELAQQSGARSVVASLWPVADKSTRDLMVTFYEKLKEGKITSKIEALRQAQLELAGLEDLLKVKRDKKKAGKVTSKKTRYSHPYYWGPFILIGNWR
jgi:CHAT domain-containing protein/Tfp pilus assembly protein PilF